MANVTYTVVKGDNLTKIAAKYNTTVQKLVDLNHIKNPNYIVVGQVLIVSGTAATVKTNNTSRANVTVFGLQSNTDRTMYAAWTWDKEHTKEYKTIWYYATGDGLWFIGSESTTTSKQSIYTAPNNATKVKFKVKPISTTRTVNKKTTNYWTAGWSTEKSYNFSNNPPLTPPVPTVEIVDFKLNATLDNLDVNGTQIEFQVVRDNSKVFSTGKATIKTAHASYSCTVKAGSEYKVRVRSIRDKDYSDWSEYSDNLKTPPSASKGILELRALSTTSVFIDWASVSNAKSYDVEYTTEKRYFDSSSEVKSTSIEAKVNHAEITGLETGKEWFFRVRSVNDKGKSAWTDIKSIVIGKDPAPPTTWSSTTTAIVGDQLVLYWLHNCEDGSAETYAEIETNIDGVIKTDTIKKSTDEEEKYKTSYVTIDTSDYPEGTKIKWRVRTKGITNVYGEWSIERTVDIYAPPTLELGVTDVSGEMVETLSSFPFYISGVAGPDTQTPIGYHVTISTNEAYETVDNVGNFKMVGGGEDVYAKYFDTSDELMLEISAGDVTLENNITYTLTCVVSMNSGLTASSSVEFTVGWTEDEYEPNAEIAIDEETLVAYIRPYCWTDAVFLSVYRREYDGTFTELGTDIDGTAYTFITDPHPALDLARYRIVARSKTTGTVSYCDIPGIPVGETSVVIQWDEKWSYFDTDNEDELEEPAWSGSMLKLPYNIDVSDKNKLDVVHVEYIGRKHPVGYYGTQIGETSSWNVEIPKEDKETLYALRRLKNWMGDVYVREPSGSGYWATIEVSFNVKHRALTIPVSMSLTRVEGGA